WPKIGSPEHYQALSWLVWGQVSFGVALFRYLSNTGSHTPKELQNAAQAEKALEELQGLLRILDGRLDGRDYLTGERFTLADLDVASVMGWGLSWAKLDISSHPRVQAWLGRIQERPAARATHAADSDTSQQS